MRSNSQFVNSKEWLDLKALTQYASVSERTMRQWIHRAVNPLPAVRVGTKILVRRSIFDQWLESHRLETIDVGCIVEEGLGLGSHKLMGVKIKKRGSKWYIYVNYHGKHKNRCVGTRDAAEKVRRELEARLALGDVAFLSESKTQVPTFKTCAEQWLTSYAETECKPSTQRSYEQLLRVHVAPRFGPKLLTEIRRDEVKRFLAEFAQVTRVVEGQQVPKLSRNTLRLIVVRCAPY